MLGTDFIGKLPRKTPSWGVGLAVLIAALGGFYLVARPEVSNYLNEQAKLQEVLAQDRTDTLKSILAMVTDQSKQITQLTQTVFKLTEDNKDLTIRIVGLEKDLAVCRALKVGKN